MKSALVFRQSDERNFFMYITIVLITKPFFLSSIKVITGWFSFLHPHEPLQCFFLMKRGWNFFDSNVWFSVRSVTIGTPFPVSSKSCTIQLEFSDNTPRWFSSSKLKLKFGVLVLRREGGRANYKFTIMLKGLAFSHHICHGYSSCVSRKGLLFRPIFRAIQKFLSPLVTHRNFPRIQAKKVVN